MGTHRFYAHGALADHPAGYMYVLWPIGKFAEGLGPPPLAKVPAVPRGLHLAAGPRLELLIDFHRDDARPTRPQTELQGCPRRWWPEQRTRIS